MKLVSETKFGPSLSVKVFLLAASSNLMGYENVSCPVEYYSFIPLETLPGKGFECE